MTMTNPMLQVADMSATSSSSKDNTESLLSDLDSCNVKPLWAQMTRLNPPLPNPTTVPHVWRYDSIRPFLLRAGNLVTDKQAERRVLMLVNPARGEFKPTLARENLANI